VRIFPASRLARKQSPSSIQLALTSCQRPTVTLISKNISTRTNISRKICTVAFRRWERSQLWQASLDRWLVRWTGWKTEWHRCSADADTVEKTPTKGKSVGKLHIALCVYWDLFSCTVCVEVVVDHAGRVACTLQSKVFFGSYPTGILSTFYLCTFKENTQLR
jgi:hypothetical protein